MIMPKIFSIRVSFVTLDDIHQKMKLWIEGAALLIQQIHEWRIKCKHGVSTFVDTPHYGRPRAASAQDAIKGVDAMIHQNQPVTTDKAAD